MNTICHKCEKNNMVVWRMHERGAPREIWWCKLCVAQAGGREAARAEVKKFFENQQQ